MTQDELFERLSGAVPSTFIVHLLTSVEFPVSSLEKLDECSFPGYAPTSAVVQFPMRGAIFPQSAVTGKATYNVADRVNTYHSEGIAIGVAGPDDKEYLFAMTAFDSPMEMTYGEFVVDFSVSAQPFTGSK